MEGDGALYRRIKEKMKVDRGRNENQWRRAFKQSSDESEEMKKGSRGQKSNS